MNPDTSVAPSSVTCRRDGLLSIIEVANPPVNALAHAVRGALLDAVVAAEADVGTQAIVIETAGKHFGAGGTQRLPRLIGASVALDMMLRGEPTTAARERTVDPASASAGHFDRERARVAREMPHLVSPSRIIECVEASVTRALGKLEISQLRVSLGN